jgi:demethylmenaquinone methyltransferase/2-methoxy-6-polyprenyl-1,4-benzoquinol methylase
VEKKLVNDALSEKISPEVVVDCCSGAGDIGEILLKRSFKVKLINCDISKILLSMAKNKSNGTAFYICSDNRFFPFKKGSVDVIFSSFCIRNSQEPKRTLKEIKRVLKPGGVLAVLDFFKPERRDLFLCLNECIFHSFMDINKFVSELNRKAIDYFFSSINNFYTLSEFKQILIDYGFNLKKIETFMGGIAANFIAVKKEG